MCRERDSNPHDLFGSRDFKSLVSTNSTIAAAIMVCLVKHVQSYDIFFYYATKSKNKKACANKDARFYLPFTTLRNLPS